MILLFTPELPEVLFGHLVSLAAEILQIHPRSEALDEGVDFVLVLLNGQQRAFCLRADEIEYPGLAGHGEELLIAARFSTAGRRDEVLILVSQEHKEALLVHRGGLRALQYHLLEVQFHASPDQHLRVRVGVEDQGVNLALVEAILKAEPRWLAKRFDELLIARDVAEEVRHAALDVSTHLRIVP